MNEHQQNCGENDVARKVQLTHEDGLKIDALTREQAIDLLDEALGVGVYDDVDDEDIKGLVLRAVESGQISTESVKELIPNERKVVHNNGFPDRVRFNWGFHDGSGDAERAAVRDMDTHPDKMYGNGYVRGVLAWKNLGYRPESSDDAWNAFNQVSHQTERKLVEWPSVHSDKAVREGWDIWDSEGSENGRWQVQRIDDPEAFAEAAGFTPPKLASDDDAFRIVANGTQPHHIAARDFLKDHNQKEYNAVMRFADRKLQNTPEDALMISVPARILSSVVDMASSHVEDIESGLKDGTYDPSENRELPQKQAATNEAHRLYREAMLAESARLREECADRKVLEADVDVIDLDMLDDEHAAKFSKPWLCQHEDGRIVEFDTEDEACSYQREHRKQNGMDAVTGEPIGRKVVKIDQKSVLIKGTPDQVRDQVENALAYLRSVIDAPVELRYGGGINIQVMPDSDDDRVVVAHADMGMTTVNYTSEGLILDVHAQDQYDESVFTTCIECSDLSVEDEESSPSFGM